MASSNVANVLKTNSAVKYEGINSESTDKLVLFT